MRILPAFQDLNPHAPACAEAELLSSEGSHLNNGELLSSESEIINNADLPEYIEFSAKDRLESWCTWHKDQDVNRDQAEKLMNNYLAKLDELQKAAIEKHTGTPVGQMSAKYIRKHCSVIRYDTDKPGEHVGYLAWGKKLLAVWTSPASRIENYRYYLRWGWKDLT